MLKRCFWENGFVWAEEVDREWRLWDWKGLENGKESEKMEAGFEILGGLDG